MTTTTDAQRTRRLTLDLDPAMHHGLRTWCLNSGVIGATQAGTLRALTARLLTDPELSDAIAADLAQK
jgi:tetrahydromethanopterin S-methyltransferase subunit D